MNPMKRVLENSFLYTLSQLLVKASGFLLLPLYTLFLAPDEYGIYNLMNSFLQISIYIVAFSLNSGIVRFYIDFKDDQNKVKKFLGTIIIFVSISSIVFTLVGLLFHEVLIAWFFDDIPFFPYVIIALITVSFLTMHNIHQKIIQALQHGRKLTLINLSVFFLKAVLNLFFIAVLKYGAMGMLLAQLIVHMGYIGYMAHDLKKNNLFQFTIDKKMLWDALKYSIPLLPHNLSTRIASFVSRVVLNIGGAAATVGLYSISLQFGKVIDTVQSSVNKAFRPWFFEMMKNNDMKSKQEVVKLSNLLLTIYSLVYMGIGLFSQEVLFIMTPDSYNMAWVVIPILVIAYSVKSIYYFYVNILFYYKSLAKKIFLSTVSGSFADVLLAIMLIPLLGMYGAAIAFLIAKLLVVLIVFLMSYRHNDIGYRITHMIKIIFPSLIFLAIGLYFSYTKYVTTFNIYNFIYKFVILFLYVFYIYIMNRKIIREYVLSGKIKKIFKKQI